MNNKNKSLSPPGIDQTHGFKLCVFGMGVILITSLFFMACFYPDELLLQLEKDGTEEGGLFEHLTALVLLPGILLSLYSWWQSRDLLPNRIVSIWIVLWTLATVYFFGEEISWGQWYFHWVTPKAIAELNDQNETNLHNMSSWLDQKPRMVVELFIFITGFVIPILRVAAKNNVLIQKIFRHSWKDYLYAPNSLFPIGFLFIFVRIADTELFQESIFSSSELREFIIAFFLSCYLSAYFFRIKYLKAFRPKGVIFSK